MQTTDVREPNSKVSKNQGVWLYAMVFLFLIFLDQAVKQFVSEPFKNFLFAFSLPVPPVLMYVIYFVILAWVVKYLRENIFKFTFWENLAWVCILSGAVSNIGERIALGYVRDFIFITLFRWTGIYNLADAYILLGILILAIQNVKIKVKN